MYFNNTFFYYFYYGIIFIMVKYYMKNNFIWYFVCVGFSTKNIMLRIENHVEKPTHTKHRIIKNLIENQFNLFIGIINEKIR